MIKIDWSVAGKDQVLVFVKRNDQAVDSARDMQVLAYIDPVQFFANHKYLPDIGDLNGEAFLPVYLDRNQLPNLRDAITKNCDWQNTLNKTDRIILDSALIVGKTDGKDTKSPDLINPISLVDVSTVLKQVKVSSTIGSLKKDVKAITTGNYTYGSGGNYALQSIAYADLAALTGNLSLTQLSALTETAGCTLSISLNGYEFSDNGANYLDTISCNATFLVLSGTSGAPGTIIVKNDRSVRDNTTLTGGRYYLQITSFVAHNIVISNERIDGNNMANCKGIRWQTATAPIVKICNYIAKNFKGTSGIGISASATPINASSLIEYMVLDNCTTALDLGNNAFTIRDSAIINCTTNFNAANAGSVSVNCATDKVAVGAATDTSPQVSLTVANEFINTDITDLVNGYRLKSSTSTKLKSNGAAPEITGNNTDIFGWARPDGASGYSIGVSERVIPTITSISPSSGDVAGGTSVTINGIGHIPDGNTQSSVTFGGTDATGETATAAKTDCTTPAHAAGSVNVVLTNSDGENVTSTGGFTYTAPASTKKFPSSFPLGLRDADSGELYTGSLTPDTVDIIASQGDAPGDNNEAVTIDPTTANRFFVSGGQYWMSLFGSERNADYDFLNLVITAPEILSREVTVEAAATATIRQVHFWNRLGF